ncbi:HNH endonuclease [Sphingosinicella rhizophila]|uniref:HNH endonuclease n=1 Tax=Sphingosinicella rhizophila TaxID=3050082 RepID=A0ABU3Q819_9SPHN|nr:HNH endonuclease [Sphingosinicella sp. GR2756]MDT9599472.1 HNH endonuclease [Sphingosinicella sp. GR2756]
MAAAVGDEVCFLCGRPLGRHVQRHHPVPKSRGGRETVAVHPICHRVIHAAFTNKELERGQGSADALRAHPNIAKFIAWVSGKDPDFHAPTHKRRSQ